MLNNLYLIIIIFLAFLIKLLFALNYPVITGDWASYDQIANNILNGCGVSLSLEGDPCIKHFGGNQGPGYPFFISIIYFVLGKNTFNIIIVQNIILALSQLYLLYQLKKKILNKKFFILSIFIICFSPLIFAWSRFLLTEPIIISITYLLIGYLINEKKNILIIGLILSIGTYFRLDFILISVLLFYLILIENKTNNKILILKKFLQIILIVGITWTPWLTRNYYAGINIFPTGYPQKANFYYPKGYIKWTSTWVTNSYQRAGALNHIMTNKYSNINFGDRYYFKDKEEKKVIDELLQNLKNYENKSFPIDIDKKFNKIASEFIKDNKINYYIYIPSKRFGNIIFNFTNSNGWPIEFGSSFSQEERVKISELNIFEKAVFAIKNLNKKIFYKITINSYKMIVLIIFLGLLIYKNKIFNNNIYTGIFLYFITKLIFMIIFNYTEIRYMVTCFALIDIAIILKSNHFLKKNFRNENTSKLI
jgi:hypothetical protein